jgi:hypothetical protein
MFPLFRDLAASLFAITLTTLALSPLPTRAEDFPAPDQLKPQRGLPDPLVFFDGRKVQSKEQWEQERRPELKRLFQHYMYGRLPPPPTLTGMSATEPKDCLDGKATLRQITLTFDKPNSITRSTSCLSRRNRPRDLSPCL